jgi:hypothetical protein
MQIRKKGGWNLKKLFASETTEPISTKLCWNDSWMAPFQNCIWWSRLPTKMAAKIKIEKMGDEIPFEEISIFSNSGHLEWRAGLSDTILKGTHPGTVPARFGLIWFSGFRGDDLNVSFYKNMPNLHNRYISAERKISQKNPEYMLN